MQLGQLLQFDNFHWSYKLESSKFFYQAAIYCDLDIHLTTNGRVCYITNSNQSLSSSITIFNLANKNVTYVIGCNSDSMGSYSSHLCFIKLLTFRRKGRVKFHFIRTYDMTNILWLKRIMAYIWRIFWQFIKTGKHTCIWQGKI